MAAGRGVPAGVFGVNSHPYGDSSIRPDVFIDVTRHYEAKVRAHQSIATQGQHVGWGQKRIEGHCGIFAGTSYAEASHTRFLWQSPGQS